MAEQNENFKIKTVIKDILVVINLLLLVYF